jgi:Sulfotransferase family
MAPKLIFIISQPRAGSTLLQRMLASHPAVHSLSEPWIMLHPIYALKDSGVSAEFDSKPARFALGTFLKEIPLGLRAYQDGLNHMFMDLYSNAMKSTAAAYFLDKTPRYYLIIRELAEIFPDAKFVVLLRNPIAVLMSVLRTWVNEDLLRLREYKGDLLTAPQCITQGFEILSTRSITTTYESLVTTPEHELKRICEFIGIDFRSDLITYNQHQHGHWEFGDQETLYKASKPLPDCADKWADEIKDAQTWRFASEYLRYLGPAIFNKLGYPYESVDTTLSQRRPSSFRLLPTIALQDALKSEAEYSRIETEKRILNIKCLLQRKCREWL